MTTMSPINFNNLPPEYQPLLALAKEKYSLDVVPYVASG
jgi:hypothetical protein